MKLSRRHPIVRWAYWMNAVYDIPRQTSLCLLFWRAVVLAPAVGLMVLVFLPLWGPVVLWDDYCLERVRRWRLNRRAQRTGTTDDLGPSTWTVLWHGVTALKAKACPLVDIERDEP